MAWRRPTEPARIEPPAWYREFNPARWDEPDQQEIAMLAGCDVLGPEWVAGRHRMHAHRRWGEAKYAYRQEHPALATQEFTDLTKRYRDGHPRY
jgi:hypothetical protein